MTHALIAVNQVDAIGVQRTQDGRTVINVFLTDFSSEALHACTVEFGGINWLANATI